MSRAVPRARGLVLATAIVALALAFAGLIAWAHARPGAVPAVFWIATFIAWAAAWWLNRKLVEATPRRESDALDAVLSPLLFGLVVFALWEIACVGGGIPFVLLPPPSAILAKLATSGAILIPDFVQTVLRSALPGWAIGGLAGFAVALVCDRSPFLRRGILPIADFVSALPIIGIAPIMVMWFGFDWHSKAAVVVVMTFFPMLVNTLAGLAAAGAQEKDLMRSYGADWLTTLLRLRLPMALPFIFNALKINATLALIGAIVAEFFGTPIVGMGFRISTEVGRMGLDMVWAEIVVAAISGSLFYAMLALLERRATFWHPSFRRR
ncbi:MAG TPA: ABC transporter permease [Xanthobacteraceae bacterium]|nr:ABC transporter permease [Xanthobacteraceae bacterium]